MKNVLSIATVSAAVAVSGVSATVDASDFPSCSINCFTSIVSTDGCAESDFDCHCAVPTMYSNMSACVTKVCDTTDSDDFLDNFVASCASLGVTMEGAPDVTASSTAAASTATATAKSAAAGLAITQIGSVLAGLLGLAVLI
ncbi:hypothetical protein SCUCBS95973_002211 [Sporothrix curviconia]|uniref:CFEM domain-containing protein n=1 Tax=Sporothrix curviconia TaxID=1260050 RepID=A0ABP0B512_9PEZI